MANCIVCGSQDGVRHYAIQVDGVSLDVQPDLCNVHGDSYLLAVGAGLGRMLRAQPQDTDDDFGLMPGCRREG